MYDARDIAADMTRRFKDRPVEYEQAFDFPWPKRLQAIGDSLAVAYASDKWKEPDTFTGKRMWELYKHVAESRNRVLAQPRFLHKGANEAWPVVGPMVNLEDVQWPDHISILGLFEEANLELDTADGQECIVSVRTNHGMLGAGVLRQRSGQRVFLCIYDSKAIRMVIIGDKLAIEKDGITG